MYDRVRRLVESDGFESIIVTLLFLNAGAVGLEHFADVGRYDVALWLFFWVSQGIFVSEITLRVVSYGPHHREFFKDFWNVFDFVIVALSLIPAIGPLSLLARTIRALRALRALRLVSFFARRGKRGAAS